MNLRQLICWGLSLVCFTGIAQDARAEVVKIVLDAAYGGNDDVGHVFGSENEKSINLSLAQKIQAEIEADGRFEVVLTRIGDYPVALNDRRKIANQYKRSVFISLHTSPFDSAPSVMTYFLSQSAGKPSKIFVPMGSAHDVSYSQSLKLAQSVEQEFPEHIDHEIAFPKFELASLIGVQGPAVLVECKCMGPNGLPEGLLDTVARAVSSGIQNFVRRNM